MELRLRYYGDNILRQRAEEIATFDPQLRELAVAMTETMREERGIGLAAPQVGLSTRLIIVVRMKHVDDTEAESLTLVNPAVTERSVENWEHEEGCLSIPGITAQVTRPTHVTVRFQNLDGEIENLEASGMFARVLQHEIDHINGKLFIDYLSTAQKSLVKSQLKRIAELD